MTKLKQIIKIIQILRKDPDIKFKKPVRTKFKDDEAVLFVYELVGLVSSLVTIFTLGKYQLEWRIEIICADFSEIES